MCTAPAPVVTRASRGQFVGTADLTHLNTPTHQRTHAGAAELSLLMVCPDRSTRIEQFTRDRDEAGYDEHGRSQPYATEPADASGARGRTKRRREDPARGGQPRYSWGEIGQQR